MALVAEHPGRPSRRLIGVVGYVRLREDREAAEVAIVVTDDWQRRGVGSLLAEQLATRARTSGIRASTATMASDNAPAHRLMERLTGHLERHHGGGGVDELVTELGRLTGHLRQIDPSQARRRSGDGPGIAGVEQRLELLDPHVGARLLELEGELLAVDGALDVPKHADRRGAGGPLGKVGELSNARLGSWRAAS